MEHPPLTLLVVGQSMWEESLRNIEDDHMPPFPPLDAMHRGQQHQRSVERGPGENLSQPGFEGGHVAVQGGDRFERGQVVGMGGAVRLLARAIEDVHGLVEPDVDSDGFERCGR